MNISGLIKSVQTMTNTLPAQEAVSHEERATLLAELDNLRSVIETPLDTTRRFLAGTYEGVFLRLGIEMGIFNAMAAAGEMDITALAEKTKTDPLLVSRVMRLLAAIGVFKGIGEGKYATRPLAPLYADGLPLSHLILQVTNLKESIIKLPRYLRDTKYQNPSSASDGPWQYAMNTKLHYFDWLKDHPMQATAFNTVMSMHRMIVPDMWFDYYPVQQKLASHSSSSVPLLVDIGGSTGKDLESFRARFPHIPGRLVLEDLPEVIDSITDLDPAIERVKHNFFTPQPKRAKGAKLYYLSTVLHDWPDKGAKKILGNVKDAMNQDSILLIDEIVMPARDAGLFKAKTDILMMCAFSALERTEKQFETLLGECGLALVKVWRPEVVKAETGFLFEAVLKK